MFLTEEKAKRLGEIALRPARIAFDHIEDKEVYERALRLCAKYGITELSNYVLYNSENFGGKGKKYQADRPEDLYERMKITLDLKDEFNKTLTVDSEKVKVYSFPMRYIPLNAHERGYVGSNWNAKFLRAVQCMLIPTQGKGVGNKSFFEVSLGKNVDEFMRNLCMPEQLIANRGKISKKSRGNLNETEEENALRKAVWDRAQKKMEIWNTLYSCLNNEREEFINLISDNVFLPEKVLNIEIPLYIQLYLMYLTTTRLFQLIGMIDKASSKFRIVYDFIKKDCPYLYQDMLDYLVSKEYQREYIIKNFIYFFGEDGIRDLLNRIMAIERDLDNQLSRWNEICKKDGIDYIDWDLVKKYRRYVKDQKCNDNAEEVIYSSSMLELANLLNSQRR